MEIANKKARSDWDEIVREKLISTTVAAAIGAGLYGAFGILDFYLFPFLALQMVTVRAVVIGMCVAVAILTIKAPDVFVRHSQAILSALILIAGFGIIYMIYLIAGPDSGNAYYPGLMMVLACNFLFVPIRFRHAAILGLLLIAAYDATLAMIPVPVSSAVVIANNSFLIGLGFICGRACLDTERLLLKQNRDRSLIELQKLEVEKEKKRADELLRIILPDSIAHRLMEGAQNIADGFSDVTVLFADLSGFTEYSTTVSPQGLVKMLNTVFSAFDEVAAQCGVEKIKTIGDAYMAACGVPNEVDDHPDRVLRLALGMCNVMRDICESNPSFKLNIRIGIHTGPCVAGVIGRQRYIYDLWGDTVNLASRMESTSAAGHIQVTEATYLRTRDRFTFEALGNVHVKGRGDIRAFRLQGAADAAQAPQKSGRILATEVAQARPRGAT